ncbi:MAG: DUF975 family protein [Lachnospiraceae bacterium]|nr:DUF975 family protein [Lachnospiraceae bacterium]
MNWSISKLKEMGKVSLRGSYWNAVLVSIIMLLTLPEAAGTADTVQESVRNSGFDITVIITVLGGLGGAGFIATLLRVFLLNPLQIGCRRFFVEDLYSPVDLTFLQAGFSPNYWNVVKIKFFESLFITLWTLLLIVPGIVKAYEYRMVDYLLADYPDMPMEEAFARSRQMMQGEKMNAFWLDLSFLGWWILTLFTAGLLGVFYVSPYKNLTDAALYAALSDKMRNGG